MRDVFSSFKEIILERLDNQDYQQIILKYSDTNNNEIRNNWLKYRITRENIFKRNKDMLKVLNEIEKIHKIGENSSVLDIGSGIGITTHFMAKRGHRSYGIEIDRDIIKLALNDNIHKIFFSSFSKFIHSTADKLPFKDNVFNICFLNSLLEHVNDWERTLKEAIRVLKKPGILYLVTTNQTCPFQSEIKKIPLYPWIPKKIKAKIIKYIMEKRRDLVNWTNMPAIHWFTYPQLKNFLLKEGCISYEFLQLKNPDEIVNKGFKNWKKHILKIVQKYPILMKFMHVYFRAIIILAVKKKTI